MPLIKTIFDGINRSYCDFQGVHKRWPLVFLLGYQDIRQQYKRSLIGPFWITISMGILIGCVGVIFGRLFQIEIQKFLPFFATGIITWSFISTCISEGSMSFVTYGSLIRQLPLPLMVHILRVIWRNLIIFAHNIIILPLIMILFKIPVTLNIILMIPGLIFVVLNLIWIIMILAILCTRYRDLPQIINSILQILFYLSPIIWSPEMLSEKDRYLILTWNPIYYFLDIVRAPLLGEFPNFNIWSVVLVLIVVGYSVAFPFFGRFKDRIPYWL